MIRYSDDDLVAGRQLAVHGAGEVLQQCGGRVAENDLFRTLCMDEMHGGGTRLVEGCRRGLRDFVGTAELDVFLIEEGVDPLDGNFEDLGASRIVEEGPAAGQARELAAHIVEIERLGGRCCHCGCPPMFFPV